MERISLTAFFPAYNDQHTIEAMVRTVAEEIRKVTDDFEVLVVDDGSKDQTADILDRIDVEVISATGWMKRIQKRDSRALLNETHSEIAPDEAEAAGDQDFLAAILIHKGNRREMTNVHQIFSRPLKVKTRCRTRKNSLRPYIRG